jgi:hypothetical protein
MKDSRGCRYTHYLTFGAGLAAAPDEQQIFEDCDAPCPTSIHHGYIPLRDELRRAAGPQGRHRTAGTARPDGCGRPARTSRRVGAARSGRPGRYARSSLADSGHPGELRIAVLSGPMRRGRGARNRILRRRQKNREFPLRIGFLRIGPEYCGQPARPRVRQISGAAAIVQSAWRGAALPRAVTFTHGAGRYHA